MKTRRFAVLPAHLTQAFYGPYRRPTTGRIRNSLTALALGLAGAWALVRFLDEQAAESGPVVFAVQPTAPLHSAPPVAPRAPVNTVQPHAR